MGKNRVSKDGQPQWCNYDLTKADKARMNETYPDAEALERGLQGMIADNVKISLVYDGWAKGYAAYAFPTPNDPLNQGKALSARSRSALGALRGLCYRHQVVFKGVWKPSTPGAVFDDE